MLVAGCGGGNRSAPTTVQQLHQFRVVFPEGFTRAQMAQRVTAVASIAFHERHVHPKISAKTYLAASGPRRIPGFGSRKLPLEGFLFPSTYFFDRTSTSAALVAEQ
ncbi:MAG: endolytic transglycosylase MltG, partial [Acidobacteriota bacterium]|nr:endolytic transglycosylase MltG [Acidobacteriota bacterium]